MNPHLSSPMTKIPQSEYLDNHHFTTLQVQKSISKSHLKSSLFTSFKPIINDLPSVAPHLSKEHVNEQIYNHDVPGNIHSFKFHSSF
jgi:hypothetical protein